MKNDGSLGTSNWVSFGHNWSQFEFESVRNDELLNASNLDSAMINDRQFARKKRRHAALPIQHSAVCFAPRRKPLRPAQSSQRRTIGFQCLLRLIRASGAPRIAAQGLDQVTALSAAVPVDLESQQSPICRYLPYSAEAQNRVGSMAKPTTTQAVAIQRQYPIPSHTRCQPTRNGVTSFSSRPMRSA